MRFEIFRNFFAFSLLSNSYLIMFTIEVLILLTVLTSYHFVPLLQHSSLRLPLEVFILHMVSQLCTAIIVDGSFVDGFKQAHDFILEKQVQSVCLLFYGAIELRHFWQPTYELTAKCKKNSMSKCMKIYYIILAMRENEQKLTWSWSEWAHSYHQTLRLRYPETTRRACPIVAHASMDQMDAA